MLNSLFYQISKLLFEIENSQIITYNLIRHQIVILSSHNDNFIDSFDLTFFFNLFQRNIRQYFFL